VSNIPGTRDFLEYALEHLKLEHDQLAEAWKQVDGKAQGTTGIAGVLLAAAFAFVKNAPLNLTALERCSLGLAVTLLVVAILLSAWVMAVRTVFTPLTGAQVSTMVAHVKDSLADEAARNYCGLLADTIDAWSPVNTRLRADVNTKAERLQWAQLTLLAASLPILLVTISTIASQ
jgi:hypothetical protein